MSHPQPPQRQPTTNEADQYARLVHNTAIASIIVCPLIALLPPRKLDVYTFALGGTTLFSANYLVRERTGRSVWQHVTQRQEVHALKEPSRTVSATEQANLNRELQQSAFELQRVREEKKSVTEEVQSHREAWKVQREKEIKDDIDEGKGFGDMIMDQIWEVWNWGKTEDDDD